MKDYAAMSDFEINKLVAISNGYHHDECDIAKLNNPMVGVEWDDETGYATKTFDYCNNPADAWPIIFSNRIGIVPGTTTDKWAAHHGDWDIAAADANPLRAAMIVFLMMKEGEK